MGDVVDLKGQPVDLQNNAEFVTDFARFGEGLLSEAALRRKYRFDAATWETLGQNDALVEAIEDEKIRRMRSGATKREKAQQLVLAAPDVAAKIMLDDGANARHRLDACKVLDDFSATGATAAPAGDRFQITINLGADRQPPSWSEVPRVASPEGKFYMPGEQMKIIAFKEIGKHGCWFWSLPQHER
jgi:hypothetical protein